MRRPRPGSDDAVVLRVLDLADVRAGRDDRPRAVRHRPEYIRLTDRADRRSLVLEVVGAAKALRQFLKRRSVGSFAARKDGDRLVRVDEGAREVRVEIAGLEV